MASLAVEMQVEEEHVDLSHDLTFIVERGLEMLQEKVCF